MTAGSIPLVALCLSARVDLDALRRFLRCMPVDGGSMAFLVLADPGLDPEDSLLEQLARETRLVVREARSGMPVEEDHVYVAPRDRCPSVEGGRLQLHAFESEDPLGASLHRLARNSGQRAAAVLFSAHGLEVGSASEAELGLMLRLEPGSAADLVPEAVPARLFEWVQRVRAAGACAPELRAGEVRRILAALQRRTGHDFSDYRLGLPSGIERRRRLIGLSCPDAYLSFLDRHPHEVDALGRSLLIAGFFRDVELLDALEAHVVERLAARPPGEAVRIWVPACSTGEEAYSIALLVQEALERLERPSPLQVFGTDIDRRAIERARRGDVCRGAVSPVMSDRRERFFRPDGRWTIARGIRRRLVFAVHDLLRDPPFTRIDLVCCRNLLTHFEPAMQRRALAVLHRALVPGGLLLLGGSESTEALEGAFAPLEPSRALQRRLDGPIPPVAPGSSRRPPGPRWDLVSHAAAPSARNTEVDRWLAETYAPPAVLVTAGGDILHVQGRTGDVLEFPEGRATLNVLDMARAGLRDVLELLLLESTEHPGRIATREAQVVREDGTTGVRVVARALPGRGAHQGEVLISFEPASALSGSRRRRGPGSAAPVLVELEAELRRTRADLQGTIEELQSANDELFSKNEELRSSNDQLIDANQMLASSRAEIQLLNEQLQATNTELRKIESETRLALLRTRALLDAAFDGVLGADLSGTIELVNPALCTLFGYGEDELVGASLSVILPAWRAFESAPSAGSPAVEGVEREVELSGRRKSGEGFPVRLSLVEVSDLERRVLVGTVRDLSREQQLRQRLRREARAAVRAEHLERRKLASELHDDLGQTLALVCMKLAALRRRTATRQAEEVERIEALIRQAVDRTESLMSQLSPPVLQDLGLLAAIEWLAADIERLYGLRVELVDDGKSKPVDEVASVALFRAVRELLINVARHAGVCSARVRIAQTDDAVRVEVSDDGVGIDAGLQAGGLGLALTRERLRNLGGMLLLESTPNAGTRAIAQVPFTQDPESEVVP